MYTRLLFTVYLLYYGTTRVKVIGVVVVMPVPASVAETEMVNGYPAVLPQEAGPVITPVLLLKVTPLGIEPDSE